MTAIDLDAAETLAATATPGPWTVSDMHPDAVIVANRSTGIVDTDQWYGGLPISESSARADAEFIAAARDLVPALVARVREAEQALWDVYGILGFDQDGDPTPAAVVDLVGVVKQAAESARQDWDDANDALLVEVARTWELEAVGNQLADELTDDYRGRALGDSDTLAAWRALTADEAGPE